MVPIRDWVPVVNGAAYGAGFTYQSGARRCQIHRKLI